jgi:hypothetical protein
VVSAIWDAKAVNFRRGQLLHDLGRCSGYIDPKFGAELLDELTRRSILFEQMPWEEADALWISLKRARKDKQACEKAIAAYERLMLHRSPDLDALLKLLDAQIASGVQIWGGGTAQGFVWRQPAYEIGECAFRLLQFADREAGHPERQRLDQPFLRFIVKQIAPLCERARAIAPEPRDIARVLEDLPRRPIQP